MKIRIQKTFVPITTQMLQLVENWILLLTQECLEVKDILSICWSMCLIHSRQSQDLEQLLLVLFSLLCPLPCSTHILFS